MNFYEYGLDKGMEVSMAGRGNGYMDGTRGYYRVLPLGRTVPHIHRVYNIIWTSGETAAQSWYTPLRQGGIYPAKYLATSGPYHNPQSPFYYPSPLWVSIVFSLLVCTSNPFTSIATIPLTTLVTITINTNEYLLNMYRL